ncbi:MAG: M48 family metallopeptidase [Chlamydiota bacterium]|nr:M48 family metallopeptidase [Chlamydiota bacterium]
MNFWEAQDRARKKTKYYLAAFVTITVFVAAIAEMAMRYFAPQAYTTDFPILGFSFLVITFFVAFFNYSLYRQHGGSYVAESIGAKRIHPNTEHPMEKQLLNIAEEIAISSGLPLPAIYIIPAKQINAFAAGITSDNAAIAITEGALRVLNRDEVQGVIAHEFGHIYNGDMKISLRLAAMVMGFFFALYMGMRILQFSGLSRSRSSNQKGANPLAIAALILMVAGVFSWFAGTLLKCVVSREREYLADACAVQFTRNPDGIANALRKIGHETHNDMPRGSAAFSHMYFDEHTGFSSLFATHPPLKKRIEAIEGKVYLPEEWKKELESHCHNPKDQFNLRNK